MNIKVVGRNVHFGKRLVAKVGGPFVRKFLSIDWSDIWMPLLLPRDDVVVVGAL